MGQFGQELRSERESRGIALENISGVTKISGRHLIALEEDKFEALPGGVLSKGIVRGYARAIGLDEEACVSRYLSAYHESGKLKDDDAGWIEFAENVGRARKGELTDRSQSMRWAGVAILLTLLAAFGWYVTHFVNDRAALAAEELHAPAAIVPVIASATTHAARPVSRAHRAARGEDADRLSRSFPDDASPDSHASRTSATSERPATERSASSLTFANPETQPGSGSGQAAAPDR